MKRLIIAMLTALALTACQPDNASQDILAPVPELRHGLMQGYLHEEPPLNSAAFLPPPPTSGSAQQAADDAASEAMRVLEGSARWTQAAVDAELHFPAAAQIFSCVLGVSVTEAQTPALYRLLQRSLTDFGLASYPAKRAHQRQRPFLLNGGEICTPDDREMLETDGSYPSGHSAIGWGWALTLSQLAPERAEALLARGRAYAQSRVVCNVHWLSDTEAGMAVGAAAFARLQNDALFQATMAAARQELNQANLEHPDTATCDAEAAALASLQ
jgi:acid phosphatase (class A)